MVLFNKELNFVVIEFSSGWVLRGHFELQVGPTGMGAKEGNIFLKEGLCE